MVANQDELIGVRGESRQNVTLVDLTGLFDQKNIRFRRLDYLSVHRRSSRRTPNDTLAAQYCCMVLPKLSVDQGLGLVVPNRGVNKLVDDVLENLFLPTLKLSASLVRRLVPDLPSILYVRRILEHPAVLIVQPLIEKIVLANIFPPFPHSSHTVLRRGNLKCFIVFRVVKLQMHHELVGTGVCGFILSEITDKSIGEDVGLCLKGVDIAPVALPPIASGILRLLEEGQVGSAWGRLTAEPNDTRFWDTGVQQVFKKLIEGVVGVADDQDSL